MAVKKKTVMIKPDRLSTVTSAANQLLLLLVCDSRSIAHTPCTDSLVLSNIFAMVWCALLHTLFASLCRIPSSILVPLVEL